MSRPRDRTPRHRAFGRFMRSLIDNIKVEPNPVLQKKLQEAGVTNQDMKEAVQEGVAQFKEDFDAEYEDFKEAVKPPKKHPKGGCDNFGCGHNGILCPECKGEENEGKD